MYSGGSTEEPELDELSRQEAAQELLDRQGASESLLGFIEYTNDDWQTAEHHTKVAEHLEALERGDINRLMIRKPPRHSKSEMCSKGFPAYALGRNPKRQILACSYSDDLASDFGRAVRGIIKDPVFENAFENVSLDPDSRAAGRFNTNFGGVYISTGVSGSQTGRGADFGIIDDPIKNREQADSEKVRETLWKWYTSTFYTRLMPGGGILFVCTPWHQDDLSSRALNSEEWTVLHQPAIAHEDTDHEVALWPEWYDLKALHGIKNMMMKGGRARDWQALYQGNPTAEVGTYVEREWFDDRYTELPDNLSIYMASDYAVTEPREGADPDYTEHGVFGVAPDDTLYVLDWWYGRTTSDKWIEELIRLVRKWKPRRCYYEKGVIGRAIYPLAKKMQKEAKVYWDLDPKRCALSVASGKAIRGRSFQGRASARKICFPKASPWADRVITQVVAFGGGGAIDDDAFDVMAHICNAVDQLNATEKKPKKKRITDGWRQESTDVDRWRII